MTSTAVPARAAEEAEPETAEPARGNRWGWLRSDYARVLAIVLAWNVVLIAVAWLFGPSTPASEGIPKTGVGSTLSLLSHTYRWDAGNYGEIAAHAYTGSYVPTRAFYPVFPILVWLVQTVSFGTLGLLAAGFLVNVVATWLAAVALLQIGRHFFAGERARGWSSRRSSPPPPRSSCTRSTARRCSARWASGPTCSHCAASGCGWA